MQLLEGNYQPAHLTKETDPHCFNRNIKNAYIEAVVDNLNRRFPDVQVISAFGIFNPERVPDTTSESYFYLWEPPTQHH